MPAGLEKKKTNKSNPKSLGLVRILSLVVGPGQSHRCDGGYLKLQCSETVQLGKMTLTVT